MCAAGTLAVDGETSRGRRRHAPRSRLKLLAGRRHPAGQWTASHGGRTAMPPACPLGAPSPPPPRLGGRSDERAAVTPPRSAFPRDVMVGAVADVHRRRHPDRCPRACRRVGGSLMTGRPPRGALGAALRAHAVMQTRPRARPGRTADRDKTRAPRNKSGGVRSPNTPRRASGLPGAPRRPKSAKPPRAVRWTWPHARPACDCGQPAGKHLRAHTPRSTWGRVERTPLPPSPPRRPTEAGTTRQR